LIQPFVGFLNDARQAGAALGPPPLAPVREDQLEALEMQARLVAVLFQRFAEFRRRYVEELRDQRSALAELRARARRGPLTLVYGAKDSEHNDAVVLAEVLRRGLPGRVGG